MNKRFRDSETLNYWPGFVDALSSVLLVIVFVLVVFIVGQFYLGMRVQNQEISLNAHSQALSNERLLRSNLLRKLQSATLTHAALKGELEQSLAREGALADHVEAVERKLLGTKEENLKLQDMVSSLTAERTKLGDELEEMRMNYAEVAHLADMAKHRSLFLTQVSQAFAKLKGFRQQGDRFVCDSSLLFSSGSDTLTPEGLQQIQTVAETVKKIEQQLPRELNWILRIDGHTDAIPIRNERFRSNWELSVARAMAVVKALQNFGIPSHRLAAAGFGEHHPARVGASMAENRRIEIRLDTL